MTLVPSAATGTLIPWRRRRTILAQFVPLRSRRCPLDRSLPTPSSHQQILLALLNQEFLQLDQIPRVGLEEGVRDVAQDGRQPQYEIEDDVEGHFALGRGVKADFTAVQVEHEGEEDVDEVAQCGDQADDAGEAKADAADVDAVVQAVGTAADGEEDFGV